MKSNFNIKVLDHGKNIALNYTSEDGEDSTTVMIPKSEYNSMVKDYLNFGKGKAKGGFENQNYFVSISNANCGIVLKLKNGSSKEFDIGSDNIADFVDALSPSGVVAFKATEGFSPTNHKYVFGSNVIDARNYANQRQKYTMLILEQASMKDSVMNTLKTYLCNKK